MKNETLAELTNEKLLKRRNLLKGIVIGFGIFFIITLGIVIFLFATKGTKKIPMVTLLPVFTLPLTLTPIMISLANLNKEVKARNL